MRSLAINLKKIYLSPWSLLLLVFNIFISTFTFVNVQGWCGEFIDYVFTFNIFLEIYTAILTVYIVHGTTEAEYGLVDREKIIIVKYLTAVIVSLSYMPVVIIYLAVGGIWHSISPFLLASYFLYYFCATFAQVVFTVAFSLGFAYLINHKSAYFVSVLASMPFMPFIQTYVRKNTYEFDQSFLNLFNIVYDETYRIRYYGFGMPFNSETILSWIITVITGVVILSLILLLRRGFKVKGSIIILGLMLCGAISIIPLSNRYFYNCPQAVGYIWEDVDNDFYEEPPLKVDICHTYNDEKSPVIKKYEMKLSTGNTLTNECLIYLDLHGNNSVNFRLDECFEIDELLVDNNKVNYNRTGDYFEITGIPDRAETSIAVKYSGRMNYTDGLSNKTDFCDYNAGYLSDIFAWYPKILSEQNMAQEKDFVVSIDSVNTFVTNIDNAELHSAGSNTISGRKTDVFFYIGNITAIDYGGKRIILPLEYKNKKSSLDTIIQCFQSGFMTKQGYFSSHTLNDVDRDYLNSLSSEESLELLRQQEDKKWTTDEQLQKVDTVLIMPVSYDFVLSSFINENYCFMCEYAML